MIVRDATPIDCGTIVHHGNIVRTTTRNVKLLSPGSNIGMTWEDSFSIYRFFDRNLTQTIEPGGEARREPWRHMLGDNNGGRVSWHLNQDFFDCLSTSGRRTDTNQFLG